MLCPFGAILASESIGASDERAGDSAALGNRHSDEVTPHVLDDHDVLVDGFKDSPAEQQFQDIALCSCLNDTVHINLETRDE